jgi:hypothetical protein
MVARVQVVQTGPQQLRVIFHRLGEEPQVMIARDGEHAWAHAIGLISQHEELRHGDTLTVRRTDEAPDVTLVPGPGGGR